MLHIELIGEREFSISNLAPLRISVDNKEYLFIGRDDRFSEMEEQLHEEGRIGRRTVWHCSSG